MLLFHIWAWFCWPLLPIEAKPLQFLPTHKALLLCQSSSILNRDAQPFRIQLPSCYSNLSLIFLGCTTTFCSHSNSAIAVPFLVKYLPAVFDRDALSLPFRIQMPSCYSNLSLSLRHYLPTHKVIFSKSVTRKGTATALLSGKERQ